MFKKRKVTVAVGIALSAISMSALACDPPTITKFTMSQGVVNGVSTGVLEGVIPACNTGTYYPQLRLSAEQVFFNGPVTTGEPFSIPLAIDSISDPVTLNPWAEIRKDDSINGTVVANTSATTVTFADANLPNPTNQVTEISEDGGRVVTLPPPATDNCPLTTDTNLAKSRTNNYCYLEFTQGSAVLSPEKDVLIGQNTPGSQQTVAWKISKYDYGNTKHQLATGSATVSIQALTGDFSLSVPGTLQATQDVSATISEPGAKLAISAAEAQAFSQGGDIGYFIDFTSLPAGLTASALNGEVTLSGKLMATGDLTIAYTPKRVLADGTVFAQTGKTVTATATAPASGVTVLTAKTIGRYETVNITPSIANGVCETVSANTAVVPPEGACLFTWTDTGSLTANGTTLTGTPNQTGTINAAWKVEFAYGFNRIQLDSGTTAITVGDVAMPSMTINAPATTKALALTRYEAHLSACQVANNQAAATTLAQQSGKPACFLEAGLPQDFILESVAPQPDLLGGGGDSWMVLISGTYSGSGTKTASFTLKKALPDGSVIAASPLQSATTVTGHGYDYKLNAPVRVRSTKTATATLQAQGASCNLTADATAVNMLSTPADQRKCIVDYDAPQAWTVELDSLTGTMPEDGDVTLQWAIKYPLQNGQTVTSVTLATGSKTITGYVPTAPVFRMVGKPLSDTAIGTNTKGELGSLVVDQVTTGLTMTAQVTDSNGSVLAEVPSLSVKNPKTIKVATLGSAQLFSPSTVKVKVGYTGDDADVFAEKTIQVVRVPDVLPGIKFTAPKRAKLGENASVLVQLGEVTRGAFSNDPNRIGSWKVRLAKVNADKTLTYLTDFQAVTAANGEATITLLADDAWIGSPLVGISTLDTSFAAAAKTLQTSSFLVQEYVWPSFDLEVKQPAAFAPSAVRLRLLPGDKRFLAQSVESANKVIYTWSFPANVTVVKTDGPVAYVTMDQSGQYEVSLEVADPNNNSTTVTKTVQVAEPAPFLVNMKMYSANKWPNRAPASFALRSEITGGHPADKVANYALTVDDHEVHNAATPPRTLAFDTAGQHDIELKITSKMGATGTFTKTLDLAQNQNPQCQLSQKASRGIGSVVANCTDTDGKIVKYTWVIDGQTKTASRNYYSFPVATGGSSVEVTATDDAGGTTTMSTAVSAQ